MFEGSRAQFSRILGLEEDDFLNNNPSAKHAKIDDA